MVKEAFREEFSECDRTLRDSESDLFQSVSSLNKENYKDMRHKLATID